MSEEELKTYYNVILDAWKGLKVDLPAVSDDQAWWNDRIDKYAEIANRYEETPAWLFAVRVTKACLYEMERICNERRQHESV